MTEIEKQARELITKVIAKDKLRTPTFYVDKAVLYEALCNALEQKAARAAIRVIAPAVERALRERDQAVEALREIAALDGEINPSNYDHDDACYLNRQFCYAGTIATQPKPSPASKERIMMFCEGCGQPAISTTKAGRPICPDCIEEGYGDESPAMQPPSKEPDMSEMVERVAQASEEVERLSRELDITNPDHIALWIEANTIPDVPMNQCVSWLACRIVEAHERAIAAIQADAAPVAWQVRCLLPNATRQWQTPVLPSLLEAVRKTGKDEAGIPYEYRPLYAHPPVDDRVSTSSPVDDRQTGNTSDKPDTAPAVKSDTAPVSDKLRPAVEVWEDAYGSYMLNEVGQDYEAAAAVIEADRAALVAEIVADLRSQAWPRETVYAEDLADMIEAKWAAT